MKAGICLVVALMGAMGMVGEVAAAETNSSLAPLTAEIKSSLAPLTIVLAQAAASGTESSSQQPGYLLTECAEIPTMAEPTSAERGVDAAGLLTTFLGNRSNRYIDEATTATVKITLLESPTHGKLVANTADSGRIYYMYFINDAESGYAGKDKAVFMAEFEGKAYKVVVNMLVGPIESFPTNAGSSCPPPKLIKISSKPVSGSSSRIKESMGSESMGSDSESMGSDSIDRIRIINGVRLEL
jgi:hypothetical protein